MRVGKRDDLNQWFIRNKGWAGSDGVYTHPFNHKILWYFSDTIVGEVDENVQRKPGFQMVNNSFALSKGDQIEFLLNHKNGLLTSFFTPEEKNAIYWLQDGVIYDNNLYIYAILVVYVENQAVPFKVERVDLIKVPIKENELLFDDYQIIKMNLCYGDKIQTIFGAATLTIDEYLYVFGYQDTSSGKNMVLSRVKLDEIENESKYEFLGETFTKDKHGLKCLLKDVAAEFSVIKHHDEYLITYTKGSIGKDIYLAKTNDIRDEVKDITKIYTIDDEFTSPNIIYYNAKMVRCLSGENHYIISYHVNTTVNDEHIDARIYRPRFIELIKE